MNPRKWLTGLLSLLTISTTIAENAAIEVTGDSYTLTEDLHATNNLEDNFYGIYKEVGDLTLEGAYDINVSNASVLTHGGVKIYGVKASDDINLINYGGDITVSNIVSNSSNSALEYAIAIALETNSYDNVLGTLEGNVTVSTKGGSAIITDSEYSYAVAKAESAGIMGHLQGDLSGSIKLLATGGVAMIENSSHSLNSAGAGASASGCQSIEGDFTGEIHAIVTGGQSVADGGMFSHPDAFSEASAFAVDGNIGGDTAGIINVFAKGGEATVKNSLAKQHGGAVAEAKTCGINGNIAGNVSGKITSSSMGGTAVSNTNAFSSSYASAVQGVVGGGISGDIQTIAEGGVASAGQDAYANATAKGLWGDVDGTLSGSIFASSQAGLVLESKNAFAKGEASGIEGSTDSTVAGQITSVAIGGTAIAEEKADVSARAKGISGYIDEGDFSGYIKAVATGGSATARDVAYAGAIGVGIGDGIDGHLTGSIDVVAIGGTAKATQNASTVALAFGVGGHLIEGDVTGVIRVSAEGGVATSSGDSRADADSYGLGNGVGWVNVTGDFSGAILSTATGGESNGTSWATAYGISGEVEGDVSGSILTIATAGVADQSAAARAYGIDGGVVGDISGNVNVMAIGGKAETANAYAFAVKYPSFSLSGNITAFAVGGTANSEENANAGAFSYGVWDGEFNEDVTGTVKALAIAGTENGESATAGASGIHTTEDLSLNGASVVGEAFTNNKEGYVTNEFIKDSHYYRDFVVGSYSVFSFGGNVDAANSMLLGAIYCKDDVSLSSCDFTSISTTTIKGDFNVNGGSTLGFQLYEDVEDALNSRIFADTAVIEEGTNIRLGNGKGVSGADVVGKEYKLVVANDLTVDVESLQDDVKTIFEADYFVSSEDGDVREGGTNSLTAKVTGLKQQQVVDQTKANRSAVNVLGQTVSKACGITRSMARGKGGSDIASEIPQGSLLASAMMTGGLNANGTSEWLSYFRQFNDLGELDSDGSTLGSEWNSNGFMVGLEKLYERKLILGVAGGGSWTDLDGKDGAGGGFSKMLLTTAYASFFTDSWYADSGLIYGRSWNDTERFDTAGDRYEGDYNANYFGGWLETGFNVWENENNMLEPYARLTYLSGHHDSYTDEGGAAPMKVNGNNTDNLLGEAGFRFGSEWKIANESKIRTELKVGAQYEFLDQNVVSNVEIIGVNQRTESPEADRLALTLGARVDWLITDALEFGIGYEPVIADNWNNHTLDFTLKYEF